MVVSLRSPCVRRGSAVTTAITIQALCPLGSQEPARQRSQSRCPARSVPAWGLLQPCVSCGLGGPRKVFYFWKGDLLMPLRLPKHTLIVVCLGLLAALAVPSVSRADNRVAPGWDLFATQPGTSFMGVPFTGVPLGTFNFGGTIGTQPTGDTDTIVQR